jgi:uncharacterized protein (TIGR03435 family)
MNAAALTQVYGQTHRQRGALLNDLVRYAFDVGPYEVKGLPRKRLSYSIEAIVPMSATESDIRRTLQDLTVTRD